MIKVVVPWTSQPQVEGRNLIPELHERLEADGIQADFVDLGSDTHAYYGLLRGLWEKGEGFCNIEHDNLPHAGAIAELEKCDEPWCGFTYDFNGEEIIGIGCMKFSATLIDAVPELFIEVAKLVPSVNWSVLDTAIHEILNERHFEVHRHAPPIEHFHNYAEQLVRIEW